MRERTPLRRALIEQLPNLKLIASTGPRNASIDLEAAAERGIKVVHTGYFGSPTVELTWALILASARHIVAEAAAVRDGGWQHSIGDDLSGKTLGLIGLGNLGSKVADIGLAFGMQVIAWSQNLTAEKAAAAGAALVSKEELLRRSDVVSIHLVLSERSRGLIGAAELSLMKPTARLVNTSRGPIVVEAALIAALRNGSNRRRGHRCLRHRTAAGQSSVPENPQSAGNAAHRLRVARTVRALLPRHRIQHSHLAGRDYTCLTISSMASQPPLVHALRDQGTDLIRDVLRRRLHRGRRIARGLQVWPLRIGILLEAQTAARVRLAGQQRLREALAAGETRRFFPVFPKSCRAAARTRDAHCRDNAPR